MKAADRLAQVLGSNIDESMGAHRQAATGGMFPGAVHGGPEKYQGSSRIKDALAIELDRIAPDPDQPRKEFDPEALQSLAASLKDRGQLQPIRVRWSTVDNSWVIVSGERRWRAARMAGLATLACVEAKGEMTPSEILEDQLVENCIREDLKPIEQAKAFRALLDTRGCSGRQLAESLGISHQAVGRALSLLSLSGELQEQVDSGLVPASAASEVAKVKDDDARREIASKIAAGELTRDQTIDAVRKAGRISKGRGAKPRKPTVRTIRTTSARVTVEFKRAVELAEVRAALVEALSRVDAELGGEQVAA
jgi:ParB family transcriptional regulator, chromosome partitioning protein